MENVANLVSPDQAKDVIVDFYRAVINNPSYRRPMRLEDMDYQDVDQLMVDLQRFCKVNISEGDKDNMLRGRTSFTTKDLEEMVSYIVEKKQFEASMR